MNKTWERPKIPEEEWKKVEVVYNGQLHMKGTAWEQICVQDEWIALAALILQTQGLYQGVVLVAAISKQDISHLWASGGTEAILPSSDFSGLMQDIIPEQEKLL